MDDKYSVEKNSEFYAFIEIKREEIKSLNISKDKKDMLYLVVNETIERHEENKASYFSGIKYSQELSKTLESLVSSYLKFNLEAEKFLSILENNYKKSENLLFEMKELHINNKCSKSKTPKLP